MHKLIVIFVTVYSIAKGQQYEGDLCVDKRTDSRGHCKLLPQCPSAIANLRKGIYPTGCGFSGREIIVCCVETESTTIIHHHRKANKVCRHYSQYIWSKEVSPTLLVGAEDIVRRECPFDRLELVVGGSPATRKEFPHMVQLGYGDNPVRWACGGSLISEQFVLTAAHCLDDRSLGNALYARMGFIDIDDPEHLQEFNIIQRFAHPQYFEPSHYHDIGLAKLAKQAQLNTWVRPACLYANRHSPWSKVIAIGWGRTEFGGDESKELLRVILELYGQPICNKVYKQQTGTSQLQEGIKDDLMICAGHSKDLKDTCQGDSGGPLQVYRTGDQNMSCMYDIIGVTSFGKGCGLAVNIPGVYTRVAHYLQWLEDIVWPKT
ncbi:hypothetical protein HUJ04_010806 [Dendroctonus ponderosae]|nr:hypothetical protein HUJ04_010806 [Dendroctonus ponderosae]